MPSPYELKTRWLEWHERWPEAESVKRQAKLDELIDILRDAIAKLEALKIEQLEPGDVNPPAPESG